MVDSPIIVDAIEATSTGHADPECYRCEGELPRVLHADGAPGVDGLVTWLTENKAHVRDLLTRHGALLFRGFEVTEAIEFERIARAIDHDLQNEYLGLSPRIPLTDYVFTASEIPSPFPIPQHNEMSFVANPPRSLFFWCQTAPAAGTGETPLTDMRKVYEDLAPEVRERFETRGIAMVRNYRAPTKKQRPWDITQLKPWVDMFQTTERAVVEEKCAREGFTPVWGDDDSLKLLNSQAAVKAHPKTGEPVWFNHAAVFHTSNGDGELRRVFELRPSVRSFLAKVGGKAFTKAQRLRKEDNLPMHCTYGDGSTIPDSDMEAVRDAIWKNLVVTPWKNGDVLAIDNDSTSHGRMPFYGARMIAVAWA